LESWQSAKFQERKRAGALADTDQRESGETIPTVLRIRRDLSIYHSILGQRSL
jgi:hypothetical protein